MNKAFFIFLLLAFAPCSFSADVVKMVSPISKGKKYSDYKRQVLERALEVTIPEFGAYQIQVSDLHMKARRALAAMQSGEVINFAAFAASDSRDRLAVPIRVPIRGGMLSYRILMVHQQDVGKFNKIKTADELRQLTAGTQDHWTMTELLKADHFNHISAHNFDGMFLMLSSRRVDYIPRAIYEVFEEYQGLTEQNSAIVIEPSLAMFIPLVSYFYVSPKEKRLAQRLEQGMKRLSKTGELKAIFAEYYAEDILRAKFEQRRTIKITDEYFNRQLPYFTEDMLWSAESFMTSKLAVSQ